MKNEEKELLVKDLCGRLQHSVMLDVTFHNDTDEYANAFTMVGIMESEVLIEPEYDEESMGMMDTRPIRIPIEDVRPYLRPMDSMTEDERDEYNKQHHLAGSGKWLVWEDEVNTRTDFLNAHLLDHRGLIEKGLALEAPKGMYNF